jgi:hypothetical protein
MMKSKISMQDEEEESDVLFNQPKSCATADVFLKFLNMTSQFTKLVKDTRKQLLMSHTTASKSLPFDSPTAFDDLTSCNSLSHNV